MPIIIPEQTKDTKLSAIIDGIIFNGAKSMKKMYDTIYRLVFTNIEYEDEYGAFEPSDAEIAFALHTTTGMSSADLLVLLRMLKTVLNHFQPGLIVDSVVEVPFTL